MNPTDEPSEKKRPPISCPECGKSYQGGAGLGRHRQVAHGVPGRNKATKSPKPVSAERADDLFVRVGKATDALFPRGVPSDRIIEIAEWQKMTLEMLARS